MASEGGEGRAVRTRVVRGIETPASMVYCRRGLPVNITPDLFKHLPGMKSLHQPIGELFAMNVLSNPCETLKTACGLQNKVVYCTIWDPIRMVTGPTNDNKVSFDTSKGRIQVIPEEFMKKLDTLGVDMVALMSDAVDVSHSKGRVRKAVTRTVAWAKKCCEIRASQDVKKSQSMSKDIKDHVIPASLLGVVEGGTIFEQRKFCAEALSKLDGLDGFVIGGLNTGETSQDRADIIRLVCSILPKSKPIIATGISDPFSILDAVGLGVDLFESGYSYRLTQAGQAAAFELSPRVVGSKRIPTKISLWDPKYKFDKSAIIPGCKCYTCRTYTKGYIHHLLSTHEMLAQVSLQLHNIYRVGEFFREIRSAIAHHRFNEFSKWFRKHHC